MNRKDEHVSDREALSLHASGRPGKIEISSTKPLNTQRDLSLAYSPGVAAPCREIHRDPSLAYDYTAKGNLVAVVSNGTAVLGLGNLGALAAKPVMEGKAVLFKRFADVDSIDLELASEDVDEIVACVRLVAPSFGGINLEDIKAPECFMVEQRLREIVDIPIFHDDQHGTAIITAAAFLNALDLTGRDIRSTKVVMNGAGAAGIACLELIKAMGLPHENAILCDSQGVVTPGRKGLNQWKSAHAVKTKARTLAEAMAGADVVIGLSVKGAVTGAMVAAMNPRPIVFAMANPDPEITPEDVRAVRADAIVATGRSDYPNQVNNVLGFPYIFRGALDVRARTINDEMKIAAARAIAGLAREDVPDEVAAAYAGAHLKYGPDYILPTPFDPRLIARVAPAVARAAMESGVARKPIIDMDAYRSELSGRLNPVAQRMSAVFGQVRAAPKRVVFAEGEEEKVLRAAALWQANGYGTPVLVGRRERIKATLASLGLGEGDGFDVRVPREDPATPAYAELLYARLQRKGALRRDCERMMANERNLFAACMVAHGDADAMVTGLTRSSSTALADVLKVLDPAPGARVLGVTMLVSRGRTLYIADSAVRGRPTAEELADYAVETAAFCRRMGHVPRVALLSYSNFGNPIDRATGHVREAARLLAGRGVDFEFDGDIAADTALDPELLALYPFCRLSGPANVLVMPGLHAAAISTKLIQKLGGGDVIGPVLIGLARPVQIVSMGATVTDIVNLAAFAAVDGGP
jgi:malate dehydrogenase (oxaloacetate-decarboxylating)(NADP+)